ncbi:MAG: hypothetical protein ACTSWP_03605 [Candidatus Freyarchaeota archaeon]
MKQKTIKATIVIIVLLATVITLLPSMHHQPLLQASPELSVLMKLTEDTSFFSAPNVLFVERGRLTGEQMEIVALSQSSAGYNVTVFKAGQLAWQAAISSSSQCDLFMLEDIDGDDLSEIVLHFPGKLLAYDGDGTLIGNYVTHQNSTATIADWYSGGSQEILAATPLFNGTHITFNLTVISDRGVEKGNYTIPSNSPPALPLELVAGDFYPSSPGLEALVVSQTTVYSLKATLWEEAKASSATADSTILPFTIYSFNPTGNYLVFYSDPSNLSVGAFHSGEVKWVKYTNLTVSTFGVADINLDSNAEFFYHYGYFNETSSRYMWLYTVIDVSTGKTSGSEQSYAPLPITIDSEHKLLAASSPSYFDAETYTTLLTVTISYDPSSINSEKEMTLWHPPPYGIVAVMGKGMSVEGGISLEANFTPALTPYCEDYDLDGKPEFIAFKTGEKTSLYLFELSPAPVPTIVTMFTLLNYLAHLAEVEGTPHLYLSAATTILTITLTATYYAIKRQKALTIRQRLKANSKK